MKFRLRKCKTLPGLVWGCRILFGLNTFHVGLCLGSLHYWTCITQRSVQIKLQDSSGPQFINLTYPSTSYECTLECEANDYEYALFSDSAEPRCICIKYNNDTTDNSFKVAPADLSNDKCEGQSHSCPYGGQDSYAVFCKDSEPCNILINYMQDPSWTNGDVEEFEDWMNYYPKCISEQDINITTLTRYGNISSPQCCRHLANETHDFYLLKRQSSSTMLECFAAESSSSFLGDQSNELIEQSESCQACHAELGNYLTCGAENSFSVYCNTEECQYINVQGNIFNFFGCFALPGGLPLPEGLGGKSLRNTTLEQCFDDCYDYLREVREADLVFSVKVKNAVDCFCYQFDQSVQKLKLYMSDMVQGCEQFWSPSLPAAVGLSGNGLFSLHCTADACNKILKYGTFKQTPHDLACNIPTTTGTSFSSSTDESITITTETTTSTSTETNSISTMHSSITPVTGSTTTSDSAGCEAFCKGRQDYRGLFWDDTCVGKQSVQNCPPNHRGNASWYCDPDTLTFVPEQPDRSNCIPLWIDDVEEQVETEGNDPKNITSLILKNVKDFEDRALQITSGTLMRVIAVGARLPERIADPINGPQYLQDINKTQDVIQDYVQITGDLFHHDLAWLEFESLAMHSNATRLLQSTEDLGNLLMSVAGNMSTDLDKIISDSRNEILMQLRNCKMEKDTQISSLPVPNYIRLESSKELKGIWQAMGICYRSGLILSSHMFGANLNNLNGLTSQEDLRLNGRFSLMSFSANIDGENAIDGNTTVVIHMPLKDTSISLRNGNPHCVFWDEEELMWSEEGCHMSFRRSRDFVTCLCNHATNFGVIFDVDGSLDEFALKVLAIISYILCGLSALGCILTFIALQSSKLPKSPRISIQSNRCVNLFLFYLLFLIGVDPEVVHPASWLCSTFAIATHFFGLCSFSWTALEGFQLYKAIIHKKLSDDDGKYSSLVRYVFGYGLPFLIVGITMTVAFVTGSLSSYGNIDELCWLQSGTFIWAFVGPIIVVILWNTYVMIRAFFVTQKVVRRKKSDSFLEEIQALVKSFIVLNFLLGVTWSLGFLITGSFAKYGAYIFVLVNGSVGIFIFLNTVVMNNSVFTEVKIKLGLTTRQKSSAKHLQSTTKVSSSYVTPRSPNVNFQVSNRKVEYHMDDYTDESGPVTENTSLESTDSHAVQQIRQFNKIRTLRTDILHERLQRINSNKSNVSSGMSNPSMVQPRKRTVTETSSVPMSYQGEESRSREGKSNLWRPL